MPEEPGSAQSPRQRLPTRELLLAQALDACIAAERRRRARRSRSSPSSRPGRAPICERLVGLAGSLDAAARSAIMSPEFRAAARARLMQRIGAAADMRTGARAAGAD